MISSSASIRSESTITSSSSSPRNYLTSSHSLNHQNQEPPGYSPFTNPPSYRPGTSISGSTSSISTRSSSSSRTLTSHLANQRQPPPLLAREGISTPNSISQNGSDGRNRLSRRSVGASSIDTPSSSGGSGSVSVSGRRTLGRRANFFGLVRGSGN